MIDQCGHARLAGFGFLTIIPDYTTWSPSKSTGLTKWMSPELIDPSQFGSEDGWPTKESNCYALGMVILEVLTGEAPFPHYDTWRAILKVLEGEHPERPQCVGGFLFPDTVWKMLEQCWSPQPEFRPTVEAVLLHLEWRSKRRHQEIKMAEALF